MDGQVSERSRDLRRREEDGRFRSPPGWSSLGLGGRTISTRSRGGDPHFDNVFRGTLGAILGTSLGAALLAGIAYDRFAALAAGIQAFLLAILPAFLLFWFASKRARRAVPRLGLVAFLAGLAVGCGLVVFLPVV